MDVDRDLFVMFSLEAIEALGSDRGGGCDIPFDRSVSAANELSETVEAGVSQSIAMRTYQLYHSTYPRVTRFCFEVSRYNWQSAAVEMVEMFGEGLKVNRQINKRISWQKSRGSPAHLSTKQAA